MLVPVLLVLGQLSPTSVRISAMNADGGPVVPVRVIGTVTTTGGGGSGSTTIDGGFVYVDQRSTSNPWVVSGTVAATQGGTFVVNIDGGVGINNFPATYPVTGTFWQATQPVSGPLTDAQLRATPVPVSGTVTVTDGSGNLTVDGTVTANAGTNLNTSALNLEATQTAMSAKLPATLGQKTMANSMAVVVASDQSAVPVSGPLTDAQIRATPLPVSGTVTANLAAGTNNIGDVDVLTLPNVTVGTFPDNEPFNIAQMNGVAVTMGNGVSGTGVQRVTIASDSTGVVGLAAGTNNIGDVDVLTFPDNEPLNVAQINGVTPLMGVGASGTGALRTASLLHDGTDTALVTAGGSLQTDTTSIAGTATATGNGVVGAGVQRVAIASDNTAFSVNAAQSGTWTVQPGNTANSTPWLTTDTPRTVASANNTGTCTSVTASTTVLASNASRRAYGFKASEDNTAKVHCKLGATATTSNTIFGAGASWSQDTGAVYTGVIDCIAASGTQSVCVYELN